MLENLSNKIKDALGKITKMGSVDKQAVDDLVEDIKRALLSGDVNVHLVDDFGKNIEKKAFEKLPAGMTRKEHVLKTVYEELTNILGSEKPVISLKPKKILLCGLFGSGKTSTAARIARYYKKQGLSCAVVCCDTVRPAAYEQLEQLAKKIGVQFYGQKDEPSAEVVLKNQLKKIKTDIIIVDSSGRDALDKDLIDEIMRLNDILKPDEKILVIPADIGQAAKIQAEAFHKALNVTDVIVTKMDATGKGGGALTACYETNAKIMFITKGETPDDMEIYDPKKFVARLVGIPDIETIVEKAKAAGLESSAKKIMKADFDLNDFYEQIAGVGQVGSFSGIADMLGVGNKVPKDMLEKQQEKTKKWKFILDSMTPKEKNNPDLIDASRTRRIAKGSGTSEPEVKEFLNNYYKTKKMSKQLGLSKMRQGDMAKLLRKGGLKF
ncbi:MAG: signal recognition particle protein [Candidatus Aenigmarchaeota archaeon]|nr:signal recognition particle protein [Candidatus Aenigmarchaeota archaeon]